MIDTLVYRRLSEDATIVGIVGTMITPVLPKMDAPPPYLYYWRLDTQDNLTMRGPVRPTAYTFAFDYWSLLQSDIRTLSDAINDSLKIWRADEVQGCFRQSDSDEQDDRGFHGQCTFKIWY